MSLTETGYERPSYDEILNTKIWYAKQLFGEDIETDEKTPLGKFIRIGAYDLAKAYDDIENLYYARFPNTATGISLDRLCPFVGISRNPATYARYQITVNGEAGTAVSELIVCGVDSEIVFHNIEAFVIGADGTVTVEVECDTAGTSGNSIIINEIVNPIADIESVSNSRQTEIAVDIESDYDLRRRFSQAVEGGKGSSLQALQAALLKVSTVNSVTIIENATDATVNGRPPHSFECIIHGGTGHSNEIAQAIFDTKPLGIHTVGSEAVAITDACGNEQIINFSYTGSTEVQWQIRVGVDDNFPMDGVEQIKANITEATNKIGFGEALVVSRFYDCIYRVDGTTQVAILRASVDGGTTWSTSSVVASENSVFTCGDILVVTVEV